MKARARVWLGVALAAAGIRHARASCEDETAPPSVRCGEAFDGRVPAAPSPWLQVPRAALAGPRAAAHAALWPVMAGSGAAERHDLLPRTRALLTSDDGRRGVRPELEYATGFTPTVGARYFDRATFGPRSSFSAEARATALTIWSGGVSLTWPMVGGAGVARLETSRRDDYVFAGTRGLKEAQLQALGHGIARYDGTGVRGELGYAWRVRPWLSLSVSGEALRRRYAVSSEGDESIVELWGRNDPACVGSTSVSCVDPVAAPSFATGVSLLRAGAGAVLGVQARRRYDDGARLALEGSYAEGVGRWRSQFARTDAEATVALGRRGRVLAARVAGSAVSHVGGAPIPFEALPSPSAREGGLRGFSFGRLRGPSGAVASLEHRWMISAELDASVFVDYGGTAGPWFTSLSRARFFPCIGVGLRLFESYGQYWLTGLQGGVQLAYSREEGPRLLLSTATF